MHAHRHAVRAKHHSRTSSQLAPSHPLGMAQTKQEHLQSAHHHLEGLTLSMTLEKS